MRRPSWLWLSLLPMLATAAQPLPVYYIEKPPYYHSEQGEPTGFLLERARAIFRKAGIAVEFESRPSKRIQMKLALEREAACSIGWFKTEQRSTYAWFSRAIHRDTPMVVLTRTTLAEQVNAYASFTALLKSPLRLGLIDGFSYGELDALLAQASHSGITAAPTQNVRMLAAGRIDYTLVDERELPFILAEADMRDARLAQLSMPDLPPGQLRYLMCSKEMDRRLRERIDRAISALGLEPE
ncbi:substrate-binding periplasmic protein [Pseudomonas benzenivorans]|uniref:Transporter substrate-binding domain-containing protein n=1 Tax=Pseudomonas benzenivorans TaxID=556533 RepID=A0ABY5H319_9PSED|nr:transporter substrate-binding domain-containing protein [Pseudomonas benzenivorans]UTW06706.1 transporter substrate-binding domain-containing protein [Pseudomonas benzenivorans]